MKIIVVQIQLADVKMFLTRQERYQRELAAIEEIYLLLPILREVKEIIPTLAVGAIGDQLYLSISFFAEAGIQLDIEKWSTATRRVLEIDHTAASQLHISECLQLTQLLLSKAFLGEPDSIQKFRERFETKVKGKIANQFRRELGKRFSLNLEGDDHWIQKPLLPTHFVESQKRTFRLTVQEMSRNSAFKCNRLEEILLSAPLEIFAPDPRAKFVCKRTQGSRTYACGQLLHASMEAQHPVEVVGQLVRDHNEGLVVAMQVHSVRPT